MTGSEGNVDEAKDIRPRPCPPEKRLTPSIQNCLDRIVQQYGQQSARFQFAPLHYKTIPNRLRESMELETSAT